MTRPIIAAASLMLLAASVMLLQSDAITCGQALIHIAFATSGLIWERRHKEVEDDAD